ncbi:flavin reductase family protein [Rheinheimera fenheensis]|uniref:flavin reductase family protein n=1 Tax=Rheinheimera fenheensis TaxID=3152295 RepID=UPI0032617762
MTAVLSVPRRLWRHFCLMLGNQPALSLYLQPLLRVIWPGFMPGQFRGQLVEKSWQTADMVKLTLRVSRRWPGFVPGQHVLLTLEHNGKNLTRPFSICSPLNLWQSQRQIELCCKVQRSGTFTPQLAHLAAGSKVNISAAQGVFSWQQPAKPALFIAAGSGITPIASMLLSQRHWLSPVSLYYRVRGEENAALLASLQQLAKQQPLFSLVLSDSRLEHSDAFTQQVCAASAHKQLYLCGPQAFMQQLSTALLQAGVARDHIVQEQFGPSLPSPPQNDNSSQHQVVLQSGIEQVFSAPANQSLLQSAEQRGLSPRFGCRIGVCFQCVCDKVSGQVRDIRTGALSGHGREQIQLCISQPVTDLVLKQ